MKRFLGFRSDLIFKSLKRVRSDREKSLGPDATAFFYQRGVLSEWEYVFQQDTMRKRDLSNKQLETRRKINHKVLASIRVTAHPQRVLDSGSSRIDTGFVG